MLSIGKLGRGQERYYLEQVAEGAEDYYAGEGEAEGYWLGDAAEELGLQGRVDPKQLTAMLTGRNPVDGSPLLGMRGVPAKGAVPGFDLTFSAPKSVSLLWGLGGGDTSAAVIAAHERSLAAALGYLQREACWTRRGAGGKEFVPGNGFLAAAYRHRSSRNGDPQLHTHVLIANATKGPDGKWTRLYHPAIYNHAKTASYLYEVQLRHELARTLGVEWQPVRKGIAEVEGFADHHLREFSTRRAEILAAAGGADASARARQVANLATRATKEDSGLSTQTLRERWAQRANEIGLDRATLEAVLHHERSIGAPLLTLEQLDRAVTANASHFERRDAIQAVAGSLPNGAPAAEVEQLADAFLASEAVIPLAADARTHRYTTRRIWELEREALSTAERLRSEGPAPAGELVTARVIASRPLLKADQAEMVRALLIERDGLAVVIGEAGTGKTYAIVAAAEGWAQAGTPLRAAAPTWRAVHVLGDEGLAASTVAGLLAELDKAAADGGEAGLPRGSVLLIDEAGMVDTATLARLIAHAERSEAKLVLVGDPAQLGEIEAGGLFGALAERSDPIHLDQVIRHHYDTDREAAKRIREGEGREALDLYRSEERVVVAPDAEARREAMVRDWHEAFDRGEDAVMIAKRNGEVERLNEKARAVLREEGRLGAQEIEVGEARFAAGDQIITRVNDREAEIYNRERWRIAEVDAERRRLVLEGIDRMRKVELDADYLGRTNPYGAPAIEHAYAVTTYCAQGATVDRAYVMADPSMDKQELYVAASRSREETFLYATPEVQVQREEIAPRSPYLREGLDHIAEAAQRDRAQTSAHDEALAGRFSALPTAELVARRAELSPAAQREQAAEERREALLERIAAARERLVGFEAEREATQGMARRERRDELARVAAFEAHSREALARMEEVLGEMPAAQHAARGELAVVEGVLAGRRQLAVTAARLAPPDYIRAELGERPSDPAKRRSWERGVELIEGYRQEHGISDRERALGAEPQGGFERAARERRENRLRQIRRDMGHEHVHEHAIELDHSLGIGM